MNSGTRQRTRTQAGGGDSSHMAASFTDLMASLMVIFILLFVATLSNAARVRKTTTEVLLGALRSALDAGGMDSGGVHTDEHDPYAVVIVMPEDLLFASGMSTVGEKGQQYLSRMIPVLSGLVCSPDRVARIGSVVVEGHTDAKWLGPTAPGVDGPQMNLELSQRRSMDVVRLSLDSLSSGDQRDCFRRLLSASGRGQEELLPEFPGDHPKQRRVVFKIRTQQDDLNEVATGLASVDRDRQAPR